MADFDLFCTHSHVRALHGICCLFTDPSQQMGYVGHTGRKYLIGFHGWLRRVPVRVRVAL